MSVIVISVDTEPFGASRRPALVMLTIQLEDLFTKKRVVGKMTSSEVKIMADGNQNQMITLHGVSIRAEDLMGQLERLGVLEGLERQGSL